MKLIHFIFCIANDEAHERNVMALMDRADELGLQCSRTVIGVGLASGTALDFVGVMPEPGEVLPETIERVNACLRELRASMLLPGKAKIIPLGGPPPYKHT